MWYSFAGDVSSSSLFLFFFPILSQIPRFDLSVSHTSNGRQRLKYSRLHDRHIAHPLLQRRLPCLRSRHHRRNAQLPHQRLRLPRRPCPSGSPANFGFLDQRLAVEWLGDNIAAFGGSPRNIIIVGQSSGAVAVDYWSYAYPAGPIVAGCVESSGTAFMFGLNSKELGRVG